MVPKADKSVRQQRIAVTTISTKLAQDLAQRFVAQEYPDLDMSQVDVAVRPAQDGEPENIFVYLRGEKEAYRIVATDAARLWQVQEQNTISSGGCSGPFGGGGRQTIWEDETTLELPPEAPAQEPVQVPVAPTSPRHRDGPHCLMPPAASTDEALFSGQRELCDKANTVCVVADASFTDAAHQYVLEKIARLRDEELALIDGRSPYEASLRVYLLNENAEAAKIEAEQRASGWALSGVLHLALKDEERDRINTTDERFTALLDDLMAHELAHGLGNDFLLKERGLEEGRASWMQRQVPGRERFAEEMLPARVLRRIEGVPLNGWTQVPADETAEPLPLPLAQFSVLRERDAAPDRVTVSYQFADNAAMPEWERSGSAHIRLGSVLNIGSMGLMLEETRPGIFTATLVDDAPEHRKTLPAQFFCDAEGWSVEQPSFIVLEDGRELPSPIGGYTFQGDDLSFAKTLQLMAAGQAGLAAYPQYYCFFEALGDDATRELLQRIDQFAQENAEKRREFPFFATVQELTGWDEVKTREVFVKFGVAEQDSDYPIGGICYPEN